MEGVALSSGPEFWRSRRALVTGATGIIGSWLVHALLREGAEVVAFVRDVNPRSELVRSGTIERVTVVNGDLADFWSLERAINEYETDTVFHLGAQAIVEVAHRFPLQTFESNIRGTYNLLEACRLHAAIVERIVIASSDKAYGEQPDLPYTEDMPLLAQHPYDVSKSCADMLAQAYARTYGTPVAIARCGNVYGGGDLNWSRVVPGTIRACLEGRHPVIRSDGTYRRDYLYVEDAARAYQELAELLDDERARGEAFNFGTSDPLTVLEVVEAVQRTMGCEHLEPSIRDTAEGEIRDQSLAIGKIQALSGWQAEVSLERGLEQTVEWYRAHAGV